MSQLFADRFAVEGDARSGGMADVYRARDRTTGALVALKVLRVQYDGHDAERFAREARALAELEHPSIVRYVAHGVERGAHFLAMEWLEGEDLAERLRRAPLDVREAVRLGRRVATALAHAHAHGVVHRDVKPGNVFLVGGAVDQAKLIDFGIARLDAATPLTRSGMLVGSPGYVAPEQARGENPLDPRADLFGLGCVIYRCVAGHAAFRGDSAVAILAKILFDEVPPLAEARPDVPAALGELVAKLLAKTPEERPASAATTAALFERIEAELEAPHERASPPAATAIGSHERRLVSVLLVAPPVTDDDSPRTDTIPMHHLAGVVDPVREAAASFGARVEQLADGTLVLTLGGEGSATDRAAEAARCALAVRAVVPATRMALATGHGLAGSRVPLGDAIDRATRMLAAEPRDGVALDAVTAGLLQGAFEIDASGPAPALLAEREHAETTRRLLGKESPFVGRERELGTLLGLFEECVGEPSARAALVTAPPGMGKSRLRYELLRRVARDRPDAQVWIARGDPVRSRSPYAMLSEIVRRAAGVVDGEAPDVSMRKLRERVALRLPEESAERVAEFLGEIAAVRFPDDASVQLRAARRDPQLLGDQVRRAWEELVDVESSAQPLVVVLEDLHWADPPSVRLVDVALARSHDRPVFLLALARPEVRETFPGLWGERGVLSLPLGELTRKASEKLVRAVLADADAATTARLVAQAGGNALYLEELIRAAAEGARDELPGTVLAMVQARVERLEEEARRALRAASVFGESFWAGGVRALLGDAQAESLDGWLAVLERREVITRRAASAVGGDVEYAFRHALVREAAYAALTPHDRELGHRLAGAWLERSGARDASILAAHFELGADPARAAALHAVSAEQAIAANDYATAVARAARGAALGASGRVLGALRLRQAEAYHWLGEDLAASTAAREAVSLLEPGGGPWYEAVGELGVATANRVLASEASEAATLLAGAEPLAGADASAVAAAVRFINATARVGLDELTAKLASFVESRASSLASEPSVACRLAQLRAIVAYFKGDHEITARVTREAVAAFERAGDRRNAVVQRVNLAASYTLLGAYAEAEAELRRALADAVAMDLRHWVRATSTNLAVVLGRLDRLDEARALAEEVVRESGEHDAAQFEGDTRGYLAELCLASGDVAEAEAQATRALELLHDAPSLAAYPKTVLARALLARGEAARALDLARAAVAACDEVESGLEEVDALARLTYAEALLATGATSEARDVARRGADRLRARAARIQDPRLRAQFLERVRENARLLELDARSAR